MLREGCERGGRMRYRGEDAVPRRDAVPWRDAGTGRMRYRAEDAGPGRMRPLQEDAVPLGGCGAGGSAGLCGAVRGSARPTRWQQTLWNAAAGPAAGGGSPGQPGRGTSRLQRGFTEQRGRPAPAGPSGRCGSIPGRFLGMRNSIPVPCRSIPWWYLGRRNSIPRRFLGLAPRCRGLSPRKRSWSPYPRPPLPSAAPGTAAGAAGTRRNLTLSRSFKRHNRRKLSLE